MHFTQHVIQLTINALSLSAGDVAMCGHPRLHCRDLHQCNLPKARGWHLPRVPSQPRGHQGEIYDTCPLSRTLTALNLSFLCRLTGR